jgi:hypothetical protein
MIRSILPATVLSSMMISTALAWPIPLAETNQPSATNLVQVGYYDKKYNNKKYNYKHKGLQTVR